MENSICFFLLSACICFFSFTVKTAKRSMCMCNTQQHKCGFSVQLASILCVCARARILNNDNRFYFVPIQCVVAAFFLSRLIFNFH